LNVYRFVESCARAWVVSVMRSRKMRVRMGIKIGKLTPATFTGKRIISRIALLFEEISLPLPSFWETNSGF